MKKTIFIFFFLPILVFGQNNIDFNSEISIRDYFDKNGVELIEGIWEYSPSDGPAYRLAILKKDFKFEAIIIEKTGIWNIGDLKATFYP